MKTVLTGLLTLVMGCVLVVGIQGQEQKEVTLKGTLVCAKCTLKEEAKCTTAVQVKEGDKTVTYLLEDKGNAETYHEPVCGGGKETGTVIGTVSEKDGKKWIKPTKVEYTK
jgi:hypothetical protein